MTSLMVLKRETLQGAFVSCFSSMTSLMVLKQLAKDNAKYDKF